MDSHLIVNAWLLEYAASCDYTLTVHELASKLYGQDEMCTRLAPSLNLHMAACVIKANINNPTVNYFDVIIEAVNWLYEATGDVIQFKHFAKVFAGLKQWALLESLRLGDKFILPRLNQYFPRNIVIHPKAEPKMVKILETGQSHFRKFFLPLIADQKYRTTYFSEHYEQDYGPVFFNKLSKFTLDFVEKIRGALPPPIIMRLIKAGTDSLIAQQLSQRGGVGVDILLDALVGKTELSEDDIQEVLVMLQPSSNTPPDIFSADSEASSDDRENMLADIMMVSRVTGKKQQPSPKARSPRKSSAEKGKKSESRQEENEIDGDEDEEEDEDDDGDSTDDEDEDSDELETEESEDTQSSDAPPKSGRKKKDADSDWEPPTKKKAKSTAQRRPVKESSSEDESSDDPEIIITPRQTRNLIQRQGVHSTLLQQNKKTSPKSAASKSKQTKPVSSQDSDSDLEDSSDSPVRVKKTKSVANRSSAKVQKSVSKPKQKAFHDSSDDSDESDEEPEPVLTRHKKQENEAPRSSKRVVRRNILGELSPAKGQNTTPTRPKQGTPLKNKSTPVRSTKSGLGKQTLAKGGITPLPKSLPKASLKAASPAKAKNTKGTPATVKGTPSKTPSKKSPSKTSKATPAKSTPVKRKLVQSKDSPAASKTASAKKKVQDSEHVESPRKRLKLPVSPKKEGKTLTPKKAVKTPQKFSPSRRTRSPRSAAKGKAESGASVKVIPTFSFYPSKTSATVTPPVIEISSDGSESEYESCEEHLSPAPSSASLTPMQTAHSQVTQKSHGDDYYVSSSDKENDQSDNECVTSNRQSLENSADSDDIIPASLRKRKQVYISDSTYSMDSFDSSFECPQEIRRRSYPFLDQHQRPPHTKLCVVKLFHRPGEDFKAGDSIVKIFK